MRRLTQIANRMVVRESGATMVEYGLMIALIALVVVAAVTALGLSVNGLFESVPSPLDG